MELKVGTSYSLDRLVTDELIKDFCQVSGDFNPIHVDDDYARKTRFGKRIAHGMLTGAFISAVLGMGFKDWRIISVELSLKFTAPVFIGDTVTSTATVKQLRDDKRAMTCDVLCCNQKGEMLVTGKWKFMLMA